jgi:peptidoglycan hydrolase CwlO-like protein
MNIPDLVVKSCVGIACTSLVALGTAVIGDSRTNAVQDKDIAALEAHQQDTTETLKRLDESVRSLDKNVAVLTERLNDKNQRK